MLEVEEHHSTRVEKSMECPTGYLGLPTEKLFIPPGPGPTPFYAARGCNPHSLTPMMAPPKRLWGEDSRRGSNSTASLQSREGLKVRHDGQRQGVPAVRCIYR